MVDRLGRNDLIIGDKKVEPLSESVTLEWDYRENKEAKALEIRISWPSS
jgi:hypothetical protein